MKRILLPTDYSPTATNAFIYALNLCSHLDAELFVLHTYSAPIEEDYTASILVDRNALNSASDFYEELKGNVQDLKKIKEDLGFEKVTIKYLLEEGDLVDNIQYIIKQQQISLVVAGTTGNSGVDNKIFGSNAMAIIKHITVPILTVPHLAKCKDFESIGFTTIFDRQDEKALEKLLKIAQTYNAEIKALFVEGGSYKVSDVEIDRWKEKYADENVHFYIKEGKIRKTIFDFIKEENIDIMSCVTRSKPFLKRLFESSLAERLAYHKNIPLLVFHEE